jgi:citrate lyase beta subunit
MSTTTLPESTSRALAVRLKAGEESFARLYPGEAGRRQPIHVVYGGAHLFKSDTPRKLGELARAALAKYAPEARTFAEAVGVGATVAEAVFARVEEKLRREPVEDFRVDFEDGYGIRSDAEEDAHALAAAQQCRKGLAEGTLSPFVGIRVKSLSGGLAGRALRTLDLFLTALGELPRQFVVTLPKITHPEQIAVLVEAFEALEPKLGLARGALKMEAMIEVAQNIVTADGSSMLPGLRQAARGRMVGAHFGAYDYTASCNVAAAHQSMRHPACDFARQMMQVAYAGTDVQVSDGATTVMPVPIHRGESLSEAQERDNRRAVHAAWRLHADDVRHSLLCGIYQGWDLHPAQLPSRYGAAYGFFLEALPQATERLKNFVARAAQATLQGGVFDDAATGQGLLNFFLRGVGCGALTEAEALATGVTLDELRGRSFQTILDNRRRQATVGP